MVCTKDVIANIKKKLGIRFNTQLEKALGVGNGQVRMWCIRNTLSIKLVDLCIQKGFSLDEILGATNQPCSAPPTVELTVSEDNVITIKSPIPFYICKTPILSTPKNNDVFNPLSHKDS